MASEDQKATDREFGSILDATFEDEARQHLAIQLDRTRQWIAQHAANGDPATLAIFMRQLMREDAPRTSVIVTLAAALWELVQEEK